MVLPTSGRTRRPTPPRPLSPPTFPLSSRLRTSPWQASWRPICCIGCWSRRRCARRFSAAGCRSFAADIMPLTSAIATWAMASSLIRCALDVLPLSGPCPGQAAADPFARTICGPRRAGVIGFVVAFYRKRAGPISDAVRGRRRLGAGPAGGAVVGGASAPSAAESGRKLAMSPDSSLAQNDEVARFFAALRMTRCAVRRLAFSAPRRSSACCWRSGLSAEKRPPMSSRPTMPRCDTSWRPARSRRPGDGAGHFALAGRADAVEDGSPAGEPLSELHAPGHGLCRLEAGQRPILPFRAEAPGRSSGFSPIS